MSYCKSCNKYKGFIENDLLIFIKYLGFLW